MNWESGLEFPTRPPLRRRRKPTPQCLQASHPPPDIHRPWQVTHLRLTTRRNIRLRNIPLMEQFLLWAPLCRRSPIPTRRCGAVSPLARSYSSGWGYCSCSIRLESSAATGSVTRGQFLSSLSADGCYSAAHAEFLHRHLLRRRQQEVGSESIHLHSSHQGTGDAPGLRHHGAAQRVGHHFL